MNFSHLAAVSFISLLVACVTAPPPYVTKSVYNPKEVSWFFKKGAASVEGNAFIRQQGGGIVKCSGENVSLFPVGTYARERVNALYGKPVPNKTSFNNSKPIDDADPRYLKDTRDVVCDVDGKFRFEDLPEGTYFISTRVVWVIGNNIQGGNLLQEITLSPGEHIKVTLHR